MKPVTYSLKNNSSSSEEYYKEAELFAEEVIAEAEEMLGDEVTSYITFLSDYNLEPVREREEYILELLSFGVLWRVYAAQALKVKHSPFITLAKMAEWRKKHRRVKPLIDAARGVLFTLLLLPKRKEDEPVPNASLPLIDKVCRWFEATGEFREQALRFVRWRAYWGLKDPQSLSEIFGSIRAFTLWFDERALEVLGRYTEGVDEFLSDADKKYRWREDRISCSRLRIEYHLNMAGAAIMNKAFKKDYERSERRAVLLPGCMRSRGDDGCKAKRVKEGLICMDCTPGCRVNVIRRAGLRDNYEVFIIPHASDLSLWGPREGEPLRGVVASACVTTLVEGGWELKRYGVPAQCVLLENCACKKHWGIEGNYGSINLRELSRRLS